MMIGFEIFGKDTSFLVCCGSFPLAWSGFLYLYNIHKVFESLAKEYGIAFKAYHPQSKEKTQNAPTPVTIYAVFHDGEYITNEQMNDKRFLKMIDK
ncbi:MAG: YoaP domain-containing protein [Bacteroidales bacterium]|nr:YoaP domain-containing protein [Bacteroidales bacterium]